MGAEDDVALSFGDQEAKSGYRFRYGRMKLRDA